MDTAPASTPADADWTGRADLSLIDDRGLRVGTIAVAIGSHTLTLRYENRFLAEIQRADFREWLIHPRDKLQVHDVTWFTQTGLTCISIEELGCFVVPGSCIGHLVAVV